MRISRWSLIFLGFYEILSVSAVFTIGYQYIYVFFDFMFFCLCYVNTQFETKIKTKIIYIYKIGCENLKDKKHSTFNILCLMKFIDAHNYFDNFLQCTA